MQTKLQELTSKIYQEGVLKARDEADQLVEKAKQEAAQIVEDARREAAKIVEESDKAAKESARQVESELKLASGQAVSALKQTIVQLLSLKVVEPGVSALFSDPKFLSSLLIKIVEGFTAKVDFDLKVLLSGKDLAKLDGALKGSLAKELEKGVVIEADDRIKGGFKIGPKDGGYLISFTEDDFKSFFKNYLRSKSAEMLFDK